MFQNSLNKLKNTGKWQFELHLFLNKWGEEWVFWMLCAKLIHVTISPSQVNRARRVHWFPASQATLQVHFWTNNVNFSFKAAGTNAAHGLSSAPISQTGRWALENKPWGKKRGTSIIWQKQCVKIIFPFTHTRRNTGTFRKTKHPSHRLQPVPWQKFQNTDK